MALSFADALASVRQTAIPPEQDPSRLLPRGNKGGGGRLSFEEALAAVRGVGKDAAPAPAFSFEEALAEVRKAQQGGVGKTAKAFGVGAVRSAADVVEGAGVIGAGASEFTGDVAETVAGRVATGPMRRGSVSPGQPLPGLSGGRPIFGPSAEVAFDPADPLAGDTLAGVGRRERADAMVEAAMETAEGVRMWADRFGYTRSRGAAGFAEDVAGAAPSLATALGASVVGGPVLGAAVLAVQEGAAQSARTYRALIEQGEDEQSARAKATLSGAFYAAGSTALEFVGLTSMLRGTGLGRHLAKAVTNRWAKAGASTVGAGVTEGGTEVLQSVLGEAINATATDDWEGFREAVTNLDERGKEFAIGAVLGGGVRGVTAGLDINAFESVEAMRASVEAGSVDRAAGVGRDGDNGVVGEGVDGVGLVDQGGEAAVVGAAGLADPALGEGNGRGDAEAQGVDPDGQGRRARANERPQPFDGGAQAGFGVDEQGPVDPNTGRVPGRAQDVQTAQAPADQDRAAADAVGTLDAAPAQRPPPKETRLSEKGLADRVAQAFHEFEHVEFGKSARAPRLTRIEYAAQQVIESRPDDAILAAAWSARERAKVTLVGSAPRLRSVRAGDLSPGVQFSIGDSTGTVQANDGDGVSVSLAVKPRDIGGFEIGDTAGQLFILSPDAIVPIEEGSLQTESIGEAMAVPFSAEAGASLPGGAGPTQGPGPQRVASAPNFGANAPGRVPVAPIASAVAESPKGIVLDLGRALGMNVRQGAKRPAAGVLGAYYPTSGRTQITYEGDLDTAAHEIAHALDDRFGISAGWLERASPHPFDAELEAFWRTGSVQAKGPRSALPYLRAEGVAEWFRAYAVNPDEALAKAPAFAQHALGRLTPEALAAIDAFGASVRRRAGAPAAEKVASNVEFTPPKYQKQRLAERVRTRIKGDQTAPPSFDAPILAEGYDRFLPIWKAIDHAKDIRGLEELLPTQDPKTLIRLHQGVARKIEDVIDNGPIDADLNRVSGVGGIDWMLAPLDRSSPQAFEADMRGAVALMISQRVDERAGQIDAQLAQDTAEVARRVAEDGLSPARATRMLERLGRQANNRKARLSGAGGGVESDTEVSRAAIAELQADPERFARLQEAADRYRAFSDAVLEYAVAKGRYSRADADAIRASNQQYVAMHRLHERVAGEIRSRGGSIGSVAQPIRRFKGSTRTILNPYEILLQQTADIIAEADRNEALGRFRDLLTAPDRSIGRGGVVNFDTIGSRAKEGDPDTVRIFVDGRAEHWQFAPAITKAIKGMDALSSNWLLDIASIPATVLRTGLTTMPAFVIRNPIRDTKSRAVLSRTLPASDLLTGRAFRDYGWTKDDLSEFYRAGGGMFGYYDAAGGRTPYYGRLRRAIEDAAGDPGVVVTTWRAVADGYGKFLRSSELVTRLAEWKSAYRHATETLGYGDLDARLYAASQARGLIDFAQAGNTVRYLNRLIPFLNANIQGKARLIEGAMEGDARQMAAFAARWVSVVGAPSLLVLAWAGGTDSEEELAELPGWRRDFFYNFKVGPDLWLALPKPYEMAVPASVLERSVLAARGHQTAWDGAGQSFVETLSGYQITDAAGPFRSLIEQAANRDFFRDRNIIPPWEEGVRLADRDTTGASRLGQSLQGLIGLDARRIDTFLTSQFGTMGRTAQQVSDLGREDRTDASVTGLAASQTGLIRGGVGSGSESVQRAFDLAKGLGESSSVLMRPLREALDEAKAAEGGSARDEANARVREVGRRTAEILARPEVADALRGATPEGMDRQARRLRELVGAYAGGRDEAMEQALSSARTMARRRPSRD